LVDPETESDAVKQVQDDKDVFEERNPILNLNLNRIKLPFHNDKRNNNDKGRKKTEKS